MCAPAFWVATAAAIAFGLGLVADEVEAATRP
jgi:hypothetical protein